MYVIYVDILFLINLFMDMIIFYIAAMILNKPINFCKIFFGSLQAAFVYCLLIYIPFLQGLPYLIYALCTPVIPILYIYRPHTVKTFIKVYLVCCVSAWVLGGSVFSIWYLLRPGGAPQTMQIIWLIFIGTMIGGMFSIFFYQIRKRLILPVFEYEINIKHTGKAICIKSLLDTGNCLYTLLGHQPVIVANFDVIKELFSDEQLLAVNKHKDNMMALIQTGVFSPSYVIPFHSVGCKAGMLIGIQVDQIKICKGDFEKRAEKCIIGMAFNPIFQDQSYQALLHPDLIMN